MMNIKILKSGTVFDGRMFIGKKDILIVDDKIESLGEYSTQTHESACIIDVNGKIVAPGFVDIHANSYAEQLSDSDGASALAQGVTTQIVGNCGRSGDYYKTVKDALDHITKYRTVPTPVNIGTLFGHNTLRQVVMERGSERPSTESELARMINVTKLAMERGAMGFSTGLMYSPGCFAQEQELVKLLKLVAGEGKLFAAHIRDEGDHVAESIDETLRVAEAAGIPVQISHHKIVGSKNIGKSEITLGLIDKSRSAGNVVTLDIYPYTATSTYLRIIFPKDMLKQFGKDISTIPQTRDVLSEISNKGIHNYCPNRWNDVLITVCNNTEFSGRTIADIAGTEDPALTFLKILNEDPKTYAVFLNIISQSDLDHVARDPQCYIASDGYIYDTSYDGMTHPRSFGTFPVMITDYVIRRGIINLEDALSKMTSLPAQRFGIRNRGALTPGSYADITVFTLDNIKNKDTYKRPAQLAEGIDLVLVNGKVAYQNGKATNVKSGVFIS